MDCRFSLALLVASGACGLTSQSSASTYSSAVLGNTPVAYWRLNEPNSSSSVADATGNLHTANRDNAGHAGSDLTLGGSSLTTDPTGGSADFSGFERLLTTGFNKINSGYSVEYWINVQGYPGNCCSEIVGDGAAPADFFLMNYLIGPGQGTVGTVRTHFGLENSPVATDSATALTLNQTYYIVSTWDQTAGLGRIYVNGVLDKQVTTTSIPPSAAHNGLPIWLGRDGREDRPSDFKLGDVAIYDHALTASQIANHYLIGTTPVPEPSTVVLAVLGLATLAACRRRRSAARA